ncbi:LpxL/LpxP family Kdo(2)-lipid IV(A) lauroyl/palmitoleoyl acyltransferase [Alteromonas sp. 14N.309.X.WAT.G.H12]|uniref:LpxL/LpxP family Kdo(2)-lipid IV(A) lauroyl/palmitoleoyl acyltransferase n=1 Tax=Alteromonas sp. 14N.309.X.WAT.G.H12 TaxID=3120824 RepID=UPI002FD1973A
MSVEIKPPEFKLSYLGPKYWGVWLGVAVLYLLLWLPFPIIRLLGAGAGKLIALLVPKRIKVARTNFALMYPNMDEAQREALLKANIRCAGMALFETGMGWWWPAWRVKKHVVIEGYEHVEAALSQGRGVFGMALHNMNLEIACRGLGYTHPSIAFYRKHDNPLMDYLQYHGRARSNKYMIHKRNARALLAALDNKELCLYLPDQDYGRGQSIFVPFGGVKDTATTTATLMFVRRTKAVPIMITSQFTASGYKVKFYPPLEALGTLDDIPALTLLNQKIEAAVNEQPESYLWMHKRFKTRPDKSAPSLYQ